jgi:hypothetical protein
MAGTVTLKMLPTVPRDRTFQASVTVQGASPGADVTVTIEQKRGAEPFLSPESKLAVVGPEGQALVVFDLKLVGPATVVLVATASDSAGSYYRPDAESIEVE